MRVMKFIAPAAVAFALLPVSLQSAFAGSDPTGIWLNDTGRGAVQIKPCGNAMCGDVVWVKSTTDASGCGKQVIGNVKPMGGGRWDNGWIYSPEKGRKYDVELTPMANGNLKVVGYAGMKFLSKTMIWKPAPADLQLCSGTEAAKPATTEAAATPPPPAAPAQVSAPEKQQVATASADPVPQPTVKPNAAETPAPSPDQAKTPSNETASADEDSDSADDDSPVGGLGKIKIGDLQLDKVLKKTKDGKCKLDLPWFKVTINCEQ